MNHIGIKLPSETEDQVEIVQQQLRALKAKGFKNITLLGVFDNEIQDGDKGVPLSPTDPVALNCGFSRYHGADTPSASLTPYRLAGDDHLDCSEIEDGYGRKSCRVGAGQQMG